MLTPSHEGEQKGCTQSSSTCTGKPVSMGASNITCGHKDQHTQRECIIIVRGCTAPRTSSALTLRTHTSGGGVRQTLIVEGQFSQHTMR